MNTRLALYVSGSAYLVRTIYQKGGRRVSVLDKTLKKRACAVTMRSAGLRPYQISSALGMRREMIDKLLAFAWRF